MRQTLVALTLALTMGFATPAYAGKIKPPKKTAAPTTEAHKLLIREAIALHDKGDYAGAVAIYEKVLAENPADVVALYELSYSLHEMKEYKRALEVAYRGAELKSDALPKFYMLVGNALDSLGKPDEAIETYKAGLEILPTDAMLHFNLGITYLRKGRWADGRASMKQAAGLNPNHASSHYALAIALEEERYTIPSIFAASRFLLLEPSTKRSEGALEILGRALTGGVEPGAKANEISITLDLNAPTDEGDFGPAALVIGIARAAEKTEEGEAKSEVEIRAAQFETIVGVLSELEPEKEPKFTHAHYLPYFIEMKKRGLVEPFLFYIHQSSGLPGVREWLDANRSRVAELLAWSAGYAWPSPPPK